MILYKLEVGNGDIKYEWYGYYETFTHDDYKQNKITDHTIRKEFYDHSFIYGSPYDQKEFMVDHQVVSVEWVKDIEKKELDILKKYQVV